jgi:hypothetical protein
VEKVIGGKLRLNLQQMDSTPKFEKRRRKRRSRLSSSEEEEEEEGEETEVAVTSSSSSEEEEEDEEGENEIGSSLSRKNRKKVGIPPKKKEASVSVCAKELLVKGVRFGGNEGQIQVLHLDKHELAPLHSHDVSLQFFYIFTRKIDI